MSISTSSGDAIRVGLDADWQDKLQRKSMQSYTGHFIATCLGD